MVSLVTKLTSITRNKDMKPQKRLDERVPAKPTILRSSQVRVWPTQLHSIFSGYVNLFPGRLFAKSWIQCHGSRKEPST